MKNTKNLDVLKKMTTRDTIRPLSIIYDVLVFLILFVILYVFKNGELSGVPTLGKKTIALHFVISFVCIFALRFVFRVYRQVLRYGNAGAFARLIAADVLGGGIYILINLLSDNPYRVSVLMASALVLIYLIVSITIRLLYYYFYYLAQGKGKLGTFFNGLLRRFAFVDAKSDEIARTLTIEEWLGREDEIIKEPINNIQRVAMQFQIVGDIVDIKQMNSGYINTTYRVHTFSQNRHDHYYTLQRINTNVFPDVDALMGNFDLVTRHLHENFQLPGYNERGSIQMVKPTLRGNSTYYRDDSGCWRMLTHFIDVYGMDIPDNSRTFYYAGVSFGRFVKCMADMPAEKIKTVIPNFHNTVSRYNDLEEAIARDPVHRVNEVWDDINFIRERKDNFGIINDALESGRIPTRICHNDCNLNNILFSKESGLPVVIIDLDTVMPGSPLYDFGDSMRIGTNTAVDDEKDLSKVSCDLDLYESYARGYLEECGDMLTDEELALLPYASLVITSEDGIRFLMDYINGDTYYNIYYTGQNLDRARTQLRLLADMEKKLPKIKDILKNIYDDLGLYVDPYKYNFEQKR